MINTGKIIPTSVNVRDKGGAVVGVLEQDTVVDIVFDDGLGNVLITAAVDGQGIVGYVPASLVAPIQSAPSGAVAADLVSTEDREKFVYKFWLSKGLTDFQAAAAVGNYKGENSALDPSLFGGFNGHALGIGQWLGDRKANLLSFAAVRNINLFDKLSSVEEKLQLELEFAWSEMTSTEASAFKRICNSTNLEEAENAFAYYERWAGYTLGRAGTEAGLHYKFAEQALAKARDGTYA